MSQSLLSDIRHAVSDIKHLTLSDEISKNIALLEENHFVVSATLSKNLETTLSSLQESQLALVVKELTTNTLRHSNGNKVSLEITYQEDAITLRYHDYGDTAAPQQLAEGNGLTGIRERADSIGAKVHFQHTPSVAFSCELTFPYQLSRA